MLHSVRVTSTLPYTCCFYHLKNVILLNITITCWAFKISFMNLHTCLLTYIHTHTYTCTYIHVYMHTYIHSFINKLARTRLNRCKPTVTRGLCNDNLSTKCVIFRLIMLYQRDKFAESGHSLPLSSFVNVWKE